MKCDKCKQKDSKGIYHHVSGEGFFCTNCLPYKELSLNELAHLNQKVYLKDYGWTTQSRLNEMERRVILPYEKGRTGYYVGRRGENGKIQEREPNY